MKNIRKNAVRRKPVMGIGDDDYWAGARSARLGHPFPNKWASPEFIRGFTDWREFTTPNVVMA